MTDMNTGNLYMTVNLNRKSYPQAENLCPILIGFSVIVILRRTYRVAFAGINFKEHLKKKWRFSICFIFMPRLKDMIHDWVTICISFITAPVIAGQESVEYSRWEIRHRNSLTRVTGNLISHAFQFYRSLTSSLRIIHDSTYGSHN